LGFQNAKFQVAVPKTFEYNSIEDLNGKNCNFLSNTVLNFFNSKNIEVDLHQISGSVEIAPNIGLSDAIVDIVSGSTLLKII
jgi:ATP phosphoribosyltransferase